MGGRIGTVHVHYAHPEVFGLAEDTWLAFTPFATYRWRVVRGLTVRPSLGGRIPFAMIRDQGEIEISEADTTYQTWPVALEANVFLGYEF